MVLVQTPQVADGERIDRKGRDHQGEDQLDDVIVRPGQQQHAQRNAKKGREDQPAGTPELDAPPVLQDDDTGDDDRDEHRERSRDGHGCAKRQQRHRDERLPESERRADQGGDKITATTYSDGSKASGLKHPEIIPQPDSLRLPQSLRNFGPLYQVG